MRGRGPYLVGAPPTFDGAACVGADPDLFFPEDEIVVRGRLAKTRRAKNICSWCRAREACLQWALDNGQRFGIWGGATREERSRMVGKGAR